MSLPEDNPADEQPPDRLEYAEAMAERYRQMLQGAQLTWTADKPTVPGYYWLKMEGSKMPPTVAQVDGEFVYFTSLANARYMPISGSIQPGSQWAGPILPPAEVPPVRHNPLRSDGKGGWTTANNSEGI